MSYLDRLKRKISEDAPDAGATKVSKGAFVPFVVALSAPSRQITPSNQRARFDAETFEERAGIMEFDGGLTREEAERLAFLEQRGATIH